MREKGEKDWARLGKMEMKINRYTRQIMEDTTRVTKAKIIRSKTRRTTKRTTRKMMI